MLRLFDSATRRLRPFKPLTPGLVRMYVCGPTVYDDIHLGNARPLVVFDGLFRLLRHDFGTVHYVRNVTDIDDKIIGRAEQLGITPEELTRTTMASFQADCTALGLEPVTGEPRATEYLDRMIDLIERLMDRGHAYLTGDHVLFSVPDYPEYGKLSGRSLSEQRAGARVEVADYKRDPRDFILWKPSPANQIGWESPWGRGRPGWHIECSAMSEALLGTDFDLHGGGNDLLFPHHENERAQSCCANPGSGFARFWMHNGFVTVEGEKMSKSLGNFLTLKDALTEHSGDVLRYVLLATHYRQPLDYQRTMLVQAERTLSGWSRRLEEAGLDPRESNSADDENPLDAEFLAALRNDFNTPLALARLAVLAREDCRQLRRCCRLLGFYGTDATDASKDAGYNALLAERDRARAAKDFARADRIRAQLSDEGIEVLDSPEGSRWRRR